jgi:hypothetical protein
LTIQEVYQENLGGKTQSCLVCSPKNKITHGHNRTGMESPTHRSWRGMIDRCMRPSHKHYVSYGGSGVTIYPPWLTFENFLADMGERPPETTLDKYPHDAKHYGPGTTRWATLSQQARNKKSSVIVVHNGVSRHLQDVIDETGKEYHLVYDRLKYGWSLDEALAIPKGQSRFPRQREEINRAL